MRCSGEVSSRSGRRRYPRRRYPRRTTILSLDPPGLKGKTQPTSLLIYAFYETGNFTESRLEGRGQPLAPGHHLKTPRSAPHQQGLQDPVPPDRLHEVSGGAVVTLPLNRIDGAHIKMTDCHTK